MPAETNPCQAFFEQHAQTANKANALQKSGCAVAWETVPASPYSPCPVANDEQVLRLVISPIHLDLVDGSIRPSLLSDVKDKGGSVHRLAYTSRQAAIEAGEAWQAKKNAEAAEPSNRHVHGTVTLPVVDVRRLEVSGGSRAFGVFDTAKPSDPTHADIFLIAAAGAQEIRSARLQLFNLATASFQPS